MHKSQAKAALVLVSIFISVCIYFAAQLKIDYDFQAFFPICDPDLEYYEEYLEYFENDNDYLLIAIRRPEGVFEANFLQRVDSLTRTLQQTPQVFSVDGPTTLKQTLLGPFGPVQVPYLHPHDAERLSGDSIRVFQTPHLIGSYFAANGQSLVVVLKHAPNLPKPESDAIVAAVYEQLTNLGFEHAHVAGKIRATSVYIDKMGRELTIFLSASFVVVLIFLLLIYRSVFGLTIPMLVVGLGVVAVLGVMGMLGKDLDLMMVMLPTIMFVVGMSDVVHIMTKYIEELRFGASRVEAIKTTFREVGLATFLTSLTTSIGFLTLYTSNIRPIKEFGLYTAIGVFLAFIMAFAVLPPLLLLIKPPKVAFHEGSKRWWNRFLRTLFIKVLRQRRIIVAGSIGVVVVSLLGLSQMQIDSLLLEDLPNGDPLKTDFTFFDQTYGGSRPFELAVEIVDTSRSAWDWQTLQTLERVHAYLENTMEVSNVVSPLVVAKSVYQARRGGAAEAYRLPETPEQLASLRRFLVRSDEGLVANEGRLLRITGKMEDIGSKISSQRTVALREWLASEIDDPGLRFRPTGTSLLIDNNNKYLVDNLMQGLGIAFVIISIIVGIMFRSGRMIVITLIPNVIPLLMAAAVMGFAGISLKLDTSIIFTIAFGIAVDDTIHFMSKLRLEVAKNKSLLYTLKRTFLNTGKAIIITTVILTSGFLMLIFSTFGGTFYVGLLVGLALIFALVIDLTLLPVLILWFFKFRKRKRMRHAVH